MDSLPIVNDLNKISLMIEMFDQISRLKFQTETGTEFKKTIQTALDETIKPYARESFKTLKNQINE